MKKTTNKTLRRRTLVITSETLAVLTPHQLGQVAGGSDICGTESDVHGVCKISPHAGPEEE